MICKCGGKGEVLFCFGMGKMGNFLPSKIVEKSAPKSVLVPSYPLGLFTSKLRLKPHLKLKTYRYSKQVWTNQTSPGWNVCVNVHEYDGGCGTKSSISVLRCTQYSGYKTITHVPVMHLHILNTDILVCVNKQNILNISMETELNTDEKTIEALLN